MNYSHHTSTKASTHRNIFSQSPPPPPLISQISPSATLVDLFLPTRPSRTLPFLPLRQTLLSYPLISLKSLRHAETFRTSSYFATYPFRFSDVLVLLVYLTSTTLPSTTARSVQQDRYLRLMAANGTGFPVIQSI